MVDKHNEGAILAQLQDQTKLMLLGLFRGLNRQSEKEKSLQLIGRFVQKKLGYQSIYLDVNEGQRTIGIEYLSEEEKLNDEHEIFRFSQPIDFYKEIVMLSEEVEIESIFPRFAQIFSPKSIYSAPVFSQNRLTGLFIVYHCHKKHTSMEMHYTLKQISREMTAVFARIERYNTSLERMLRLTALENILMYDVKEEMDGAEMIQCIVKAIPEATGMERCTLALLTEDGQHLLPHYSTFLEYEVSKDQSYPMDPAKTKDHTGILAIENKEPIVVYDARTDERCDAELAKQLGVYSNITLPVLDIHGRPLGVLYLDNAAYEIFSGEQIRFLQIIARHLGLVISKIDYIANLRIRAKYDGLTGLFNRHTFDTIYEAFYNGIKHEKMDFAILMVDIDNFKEVNDQYGHPVGDEVLRKMARAMQQSLRDHDVIARYGGEEMIIILKGSNPPEAKGIAERIRKSIESLEIQGIRITVSIGMANFRYDSYEKDELITIADKCLYEAKRKGKNQFLSTESK
ncbi:diguanylate cyclase [Alkaliphilus metalliredigens QYMF]|uniref:Diguanylate cyclase n=1 Tax=Alkaliphilus metalliredigens (strain QYMF) TaxID=293826 RepID=A6TMF8_ALKMQ|nr:sensor domain-containing diguanylate cyclase [Alkaliphilus metalliredigens]ABR47376.1 diguanylate cyclase [Alkaliphilus metalliredigens QYMF]